MLGFLLNLVPVVLRVGTATVAMADFMGLRARAPTVLRLRGVRDGDGWWPGYCWLRNVVHSAGARDKADKADNEYQPASSHGRFLNQRTVEDFDKACAPHDVPTRISFILLSLAEPSAAHAVSREIVLGWTL